MTQIRTRAPSQAAPSREINPFEDGSLSEVSPISRFRNSLLRVKDLLSQIRPRSDALSHRCAASRRIIHPGMRLHATADGPTGSIDALVNPDMVGVAGLEPAASSL
jgi:hypothetical protein